jgi:hypothetical protein
MVSFDNQSPNYQNPFWEIIMAQKCTICTHPDRKKIDEAIASGEPNTRIAASYNLKEQAIRRHKKYHIQKMVKAAAKKEEHRIERLADDIVGQVRDLNNRVLRILSDCEGDGDRRNEIAALREAKGLLELQGKLMGNFGPTTAIQINTMPSLRTAPEWAVVVRVLDKQHPEIKRELDQALSEAGL